MRSKRWATLGRNVDLTMSGFDPRRNILTIDGRVAVAFPERRRFHRRGNRRRIVWSGACVLAGHSSSSDHYSEMLNLILKGLT